MKRLSVLFIVFVMILSLLSGCGGTTPEISESETSSSPAPASADTETDPFVDGPSYELKIAHVQSDSHSYNIGAMYLAEQLEKRSNGKITGVIFPSSALGGERDTVESAQMGTVDIAITGAAPLANFNKNFTVFDFPGLFKNAKQASAVMDGEIGSGMFESLEANGLVGLCYFDNGFFNTFNTKRDVTKIEDMVGLNIRTMENDVYMATYKAFGSNPVPMAAGEVYTALQTGAVDGFCLSFNAAYGLKWYEQVKSVMYGDLFYCVTPVVMSKIVFDSMPKAYQDLIMEVALEAGAVEREDSAAQQSVTLDIMEESGINITYAEDINDWIDLVQKEVWPQFRDVVSEDLIKGIQALE